MIRGAHLPAVHTSRDFESELHELRAQVLAMGARCERSVQLAVQAFWEGSSLLARDVRAIDAHIDRDELDIHALVLRILALRHPVADDLRFVAVALKLITDLERIGDEAVNISERAVEKDGEPKLLVRAELVSMAETAQEMLHGALQAFIDRDAAGAESVLVSDDVVDHHCRSIITKMTKYMASNPAQMNAGLRVVRVAKYLERIADHATNVAEEVIFMVRGDDVRHGHSAVMLARR